MRLLRRHGLEGRTDAVLGGAGAAAMNFKEKAAAWFEEWQDTQPGEGGVNALAELLQTTHDEAFEMGCASPCGHPPTPPQDTARQMWLLSGASSAGRTTIPVEQYEELRALATKWAQDFNENVLTLYYIEDADFNRRGPFQSYQHASDNCRPHKSERVVTKEVEKIKPHDEANCINCNSNAKPRTT
jgi:hypothetical protein